MNNNSKKSFNEKFVVDNSYIFTSMLLINLFLAINSIIVARLLGPENLGILSILKYLGGMSIMFASFNLPTAVTKFIAEYRAVDKNAIGKIIGNVSLFLVISSSFLFFIIFLFSDFIADFYNEPPISFLLKIYVFFIFFSVFSSLGISTLAGFQTMKLISKLRAGLGLIGILITLVLVYYFSISGAIFALILDAGILTLVSFIFILNLLKKEGIKINFSVDKDLTKKIIRYTFPLFISGIGYTVFLWFGPTFLSLKGNFTDVGLYKVALTLHTFILFVPNAINYNLIPSVSNLSASKPEQLSLFVSKVLKIIMLIVLPVVLCAGLLSKELILILFGDAYIDAVLVTYILIISAFFVSLCTTMGAVFIGIGKTKTAMYINIVAYSSFIFFSYFLISKYGLMGLASTYLIIYLPFTFICFFYVSRSIKLQYKPLARPFIICIIFLVSCYLITQLFSGILFFAAGIFLIVISLLIEWKLLEKEDKEMIFVMIENFKHTVKK